MKVKHLTAGLLSFLILFIFCACDGEKPFYEVYNRENENLSPAKINIIVDKDDVSSSAYDIADEKLIDGITEAMGKIRVLKELKNINMKAEYTLELFNKDGEKTVLGFSGDTAAVYQYGERHYYKISEPGELFGILTEEARLSEEAMLGYDKVIDIETLKVYVKKELTADENGNTAVDLYVINSGNAVTLGLRDCVINGDKFESDKAQIPGESEMGIILPVKAEDDEIKTISFSVFAANGTQENAEPFVSSEKYTINGN